MSKPDPVYTTWGSVLTADEKAEVDRINDLLFKETRATHKCDLDEFRRRQQVAMTLEEEMGPPVVD
jgi:hypothetical protein